ncbi:hypothetical protein GCM10007989_33690 [Devosia pacifica]|uniref:Uncharacterized protein n=1 Tax=Devosia pacifica TaxID=1335967 RepID=A0A918SES9_9HYPH|nr:hypothetical protein [Devosia pacifica]GHA35031.1 hypothetical protein GCM10007989_33690 [Devosia pacifica]
MALSNAEKVRRYRERKKAAKEAAPDLTANFIEGSFAEFVGENYEFEEWIVASGFQLPNCFAEEVCTFDVDDLTERSQSGKPSLERMEFLAGVFLNAATELHEKINAFKLAEIEARIAEIEQTDLSDAEAKSKALKDIVALQGIKSSLEGKTFRRSFAEISVKGSYSE